MPDARRPAPAAPTTTTTTTTEHHQPPPPPPYDDGAGGVVAPAAAPTPTLLQPRVAVVLGVPDGWHPLLFACRLLSICPALWFSLLIALRFLVQLPAELAAPGDVGARAFENRLRLTETSLAMVWCGVSSYLSFFFTDCLMSRWLLNYTPQATIVRLLAINALNGYLTSWVLFLTGGSADARMLLPAWIGIATILTALYHITQRKINIRKETSISISVFSGASFISMVCLLALLYSGRVDLPAVPMASAARKVWTETAKVAGGLRNSTREL